MVLTQEFNKCTGCSMSNASFLSLCFDDNERPLVQFLKEHGVLSDTVLCPRCEKPVQANLDELRFRCSNLQTINKTKKKCPYNGSVLKGTIFSGSKLSANQICQFMVHWISRDPPRHTFLMDELELSQQTVVTWSSFCRKVTHYWSIKNCSRKIGGIGKTVEIDVVKFGQEKSLHVFGGIERESKSVFVVPVSDVDSDTLLLNIKDKILPGTTVISCLRSLECLEDEEYDLQQVSKSLHTLDSAAHIQNVERMWREVYSKVPRYGTKVDNFELYLSEFLFKRAFPDHTLRLHNFFKAVGELYSPNYIDRCV